MGGADGDGRPIAIGVTRRAFVASIPTVLVVSGCLETLEDGTETDGNGTGDDETGTDADDADPRFEVTTVDAPGSDPGTVGVPPDGQVQLVNFSRITCPTSRDMLSRVGEARDRLAESTTVGPDGAVHVLTVVDGSSGADPTPAELADWWAEQDGDWTVGIDEDGTLFDHHDVSVTPTTIAIDGTGTVHYRDEDATTSSNLVAGVERALEEGDDVDADQ